MKLAPLFNGSIQPKEEKVIGEYFPDFFYVTCLVILSVAFLREFGSSVYFDPHDESVFLHRHVTYSGPGGAVWGPLYSLFYWFQGFWQKDFFRLYYQNAALVSFLLPMSFYWLLRRYGVSPYLSGVVSYLFLISDYNLFLFPKSAHFQLILIFLYLGYSVKIKDPSKYLANLTLFSLFLMFIRPKMIVMPFLLTIYLLYSLKRFPLKFTKAKLIPVAFVFMLFALLFSYYGNPVGDRGKKEAVFFQNHNLNRLDREIRTGGKLDPIEHSARGYIIEFREHVKQNFRNLYSNLSQHQFHFPRLSGFEDPNSSNNVQIIFLLAGILGVTFLKRKKSGTSKAEGFHFYFPVVHSLLCFSTTIIIYAWARFFFVIFLYAALFLSRVSHGGKSFRFSLICCGLFLLQVVIPSMSGYRDSDHWASKHQEWGMEKSILQLRAIRGFPKGKCLANPFYVSVYIDHLCSKESDDLRGIFQHGTFGLWRQIEEDKPQYVFIGRGYLDEWVRDGNVFESQKFFKKLSGLGYRTIVLSMEKKEFFLVKYPLAGEVR